MPLCSFFWNFVKRWIDERCKFKIYSSSCRSMLRLNASQIGSTAWFVLKRSWECEAFKDQRGKKCIFVSWCIFLHFEEWMDMDTPFHLDLIVCSCLMHSTPLSVFFLHTLRFSLRLVFIFGFGKLDAWAFLYNLFLKSTHREADERLEKCRFYKNGCVLYDTKLTWDWLETWKNFFFQIHLHLFRSSHTHTQYRPIWVQTPSVDNYRKCILHLHSHQANSKVTHSRNAEKNRRKTFLSNRHSAMNSKCQTV